MNASRDVKLDSPGEPNRATGSALAALALLLRAAGLAARPAGSGLLARGRRRGLGLRCLDLVGGVVLGVVLVGVVLGGSGGGLARLGRPGALLGGELGVLAIARRAGLGDLGLLALGRGLLVGFLLLLLVVVLLEDDAQPLLRLLGGRGDDVGRGAVLEDLAGGVDRDGE